MAKGGRWSDFLNSEVLEMRDAETVLGVIRDRGERGLPLEDIYRQLFNPELYLRAYGRLYSNQGAMTRGTTAETVDGMSLAKIKALIDDVRHERHRWTPVRRVNIPKGDGKTRPLGIPTWSDKLLQEVIRMILEAYYEPQFSDRSHGFRPGRGCHTALSEVVTHWTGVRWFIEGDIKGCFDNIDHSVLLSILREKLHDNRFLRLIENLLRAGYLEEWRYGETLSGTPQGGVVSPILSNIYLDGLDRYVEKVLTPAHTKGESRRYNPQWKAVQSRARYHRTQGHHAVARTLRKEMRRLPSGDPFDPGYRRLHYIRYADDFLLGFIGPKAEAEEIRRQLSDFLGNTLKLELSQEKTLITHATSKAARFLGYELVNQQADDKHDRNGRRKVNGRIGLRVPTNVIERHCRLYMRNGKPAHRNEMLHDDDYTIVSRYQAEYRGVVQYYLLAANVYRLDRLRWVMQRSLCRTLAAKHHSSAKKMATKYLTKVQTEYGPRSCLQVTVERGEGKSPLVTQFGGIPLRRRKDAILVDHQPSMRRTERNDLIRRLLADACEMCGSQQQIQVHHVRKLRDLAKKGEKERPLWMQIMAARQRKTLVVCHDCHVRTHNGQIAKVASI
jgi:group II intron reverse transcriptase/maturase